MEGKLREEFIARLEDRYGPYERETSKFGQSAFGVIADDFSISASQFTKLMYGTATEGMYVRSIEHINRLIKQDAVKRERDHLLQVNEEQEVKLNRLQKRSRQNLVLRSIIVLLLIALAAVLVHYLSGSGQQSRTDDTATRSHPLSDFFDTDFGIDSDSPYLDPSEAQEFCPCSAYEGVWSLGNEYKLPLPGTGRPGVYYVAKSADVRMKCSRSDTTYPGKGRILLGYEYLVNEIWIDMRSTSLSPTYFNLETKTFTQEFEDLNFDSDPNFRKVATIHSFFIDRFEIYPDSIVRRGEPCGRFTSDIDRELANEYRVDPEHILESIVGDLTSTACNSTINDFCDPNDLVEGESIISFECLYTIQAENLGIGGGYPYEKGYRLVKQNYADHLMCSSCQD